MAQTDLIADMLTMIRNALMAKKDSCVVPASRMNNAILGILKDEGYIENFKEQAAVSSAKTIKVYLKYVSDSKDPGIRGLRRVSRAGLRIYSKCTRMPIVLRGYGKAIVSTSRGLMTNRQAKQEKLGGEIICYVW